MADDTGGKAPQDRYEVAAYLAELTGELAQVARRNGFDALGYLLDMAHMEAESAAVHERPTDSNRKIARG